GSCFCVCITGPQWDYRYGNKEQCKKFLTECEQKNPGAEVEIQC
nr:Chain A, PD-1 Binding Miniprotein GR918.2 [synthetic construct]6V67_B Chain B, PD-1 Binding Miniprotein GR918.2 [synthetic construct]